MSAAAAARRAAVAAALLAPRGASPGALFHAPRVTALLARLEDVPALDDVVPPLLEVLERAGTGRGRVSVLCGGAGAAARLDGRAARGRWGVPVITCDLERARHWVAGVAAGVAVELDDELREAEALVVLASHPDAATGFDAIADVLLPAFGSPACRATLAAHPDRAAVMAAVGALVPIDAALAWHDGAGTARAWFGTCDALSAEVGRG